MTITATSIDSAKVPSRRTGKGPDPDRSETLVHPSSVSPSIESPSDTVIPAAGRTLADLIGVNRVAKLTPRQREGLACVYCERDFLSDRIPHQQVGVSEAGLQVYACVAPDDIVLLDDPTEQMRVIFKPLPCREQVPILDVHCPDGGIGLRCTSDPEEARRYGRLLLGIADIADRLTTPLDVDAVRSNAADAGIEEELRRTYVEWDKLDWPFISRTARALGEVVMNAACHLEERNKELNEVCPLWCEYGPHYDSALEDRWHSTMLEEVPISIRPEVEFGRGQWETDRLQIHINQDFANPTPRICLVDESKEPEVPLTIAEVRQLITQLELACDRAEAALM